MTLQEMSHTYHSQHAVLRQRIRELTAAGVGEDTRVRDFGELLEMNRPGGERFLLLPASATYHDVRDAFERASERDSRLAAVFITENGKLDEPLMGMLTPWDVLGEKGSPEERD